MGTCCLMRIRKPLALTLLLLMSGGVAVTRNLVSATPALLEEKPNILLIVTDDQPLGLGFVMKRSRRWLRSGTKFSQAVVTTPQCCPSRASIFTGRYVHNHGVKTNQETDALDHQTTVQYELSQAGYETGLYGKFLNGWPGAAPPPYFNDFAINRSHAYSGGIWNVDGTMKKIKRYGATFIGEQAASFMEEMEGDDDTPWFIELAFSAPHAPNVPERRFKHAHVRPWKAPPSAFENDRSVDPGRRMDKPSWVGDSHREAGWGRALRKAQARTMMSVDRQLAILDDRLEALGESGNTLVIFISDNGLQWGHHGLGGKMVPYLESIRVPFYAIWPGHLPAATDNRLVANIDVTPTILDAAGISSSVVRDGRSVLDASWDRERILIEGWNRSSSKHRIPPWAGLYELDREYVEYYRGTGDDPFYREYYNLAKDPFQLLNLLGDRGSGNDPNVSSLSDYLSLARQCSGPVECP